MCIHKFNSENAKPRTGFSPLGVLNYSLAFRLVLWLFTGMAKTIEDALAHIAEYAQRHNLDGDIVEKIFSDGCEDCGYWDFNPRLNTESCFPPFVVKVDIIRSEPISIN